MPRGDSSCSPPRIGVQTKRPAGPVQLGPAGSFALPALGPNQLTVLGLVPLINQAAAACLLAFAWCLVLPWDVC